MITKAELIEALTKGTLAQVPDSAVIIMAKDGEGNSFSPFDEASQSFYCPANSYMGTLCDQDDDGATNALVFWPTN